MDQTAHAQPQARRIDDVKAPPAEEPAGHTAPAPPAPSARPVPSMAPKTTHASNTPYAAITVAVLVCMLLCALAWYAYRHSNA